MAEDSKTLFVVNGKVLNIHDILRSNIPLADVAEMLIEGNEGEFDIERKNTLDRFIEFVIFKVKTGDSYIVNLAYPSKRISDPEIEEKVIELLNNHLVPEIILTLLKFFCRNIQDSDTNLYLAGLIRGEHLIRAIFDTFVLIRSDIFRERHERTMNVKRLQQYSPHTADSQSNPIDACCRLRYILEYIMLITGTKIYTRDDLKLHAGLI